MLRDRLQVTMRSKKNSQAIADAVAEPNQNGPSGSPADVEHQQLEANAKGNNEADSLMSDGEVRAGSVGVLQADKIGASGGDQEFKEAATESTDLDVDMASDGDEIVENTASETDVLDETDETQYFELYEDDDEFEPDDDGDDEQYQDDDDDVAHFETSLNDDVLAEDNGQQVITIKGDENDLKKRNSDVLDVGFDLPESESSKEHLSSPSSEVPPVKDEIVVHDTVVVETEETRRTEEPTGSTLTSHDHRSQEDTRGRDLPGEDDSKVNGNEAGVERTVVPDAPPLETLHVGDKVEEEEKHQMPADGGFGGQGVMEMHQRPAGGGVEGQGGDPVSQGLKEKVEEKIAETPLMQNKDRKEPDDVQWRGKEDDSIREGLDGADKLRQTKKKKVPTATLR